jgi:serine/threonine protein kinase
VFYVQKTIFLVLEYSPFDMYATFTKDSSGAKSKVLLRDEHIKNMVQQVLRGLEYLHNKQNLMHRVRIIEN